MDKNTIKKFAIWARQELITRVKQKATEYGIEQDNMIDAEADAVNGRLLDNTEKSQRKVLIEQINKKGFEEVIEEVAYTWFNRFIALRFMEVNGYLPTRVRVFTNDENDFKPQILSEAIHMDLEGLDKERVFELKDTNKTEELYKYLLIAQCNALHSIMPVMFQEISDCTELLLPDNLLREGSIVEQMVSLIPEEDWREEVQIIGWLYQYYNTEKKNEIFAALKKNVKITKENIPVATQLFTPDWIVRYMVENSLGRLWIEGHPNDELKASWKYYLEEAEQEPEVQLQLEEIRKEYAAISPEQIKCIDPCCGSGHVLVYLFDVLVQIYESCGYATREAVESIIKNNIYGLEIDERAGQLAYFAVMMKARYYDRRFLGRHIQPNVYAIQESNDIDQHTLEYFYNGDAKLKTAMNSIITEMHDAKEYGSILNITPVDFNALYARFNEIKEDISISKENVLNSLLPLVRIAELLAQKYDVVCTNPPYMGASNMNGKLANYIKKNYPDSKSDFFSVFMEGCGQMVNKNGYQAMITQHSWMFLSSFEKLRAKLLQKDTINMVHLGARAFEEIGGEVVQTTSFVIRKSHIADYKGIYCRLIEPTTQQGKEDMFLAGENRYTAKQSNFSKIPGSPVAYWVSENMLKTFDNPKIKNYGDANNGFTTGDNNKFLRFWFEISYSNICFAAKSIEASILSLRKWFPYNKGGSFRKWYGNNDYVINWYNNGMEIKSYGHLVPRSMQYQFKQAISWSKISSSISSFRVKNIGTMFDVAGLSLFPDEINNFNYILGLCNSIYAQKCLEFLSPTLNYETGHISSLPCIKNDKYSENISVLVEQNIEICKFDWDSFETSWDFQQHPLLASNGSKIYRSWDHNGKIYLHDEFKDIPWSHLLELAYLDWEAKCEYRFAQLKANEEELNRIFIDIYGLQDELTPEVEDKDVTVRKADLQRDIKSLISYAVGCMFGRYSLDVEGLAFAGGEWDSSKYSIYTADKDNIIPICDDEYFNDDIVSLFVKFIETVYGSDTLRENLKFIADALGGKGQPRDVIRNYFLNNFYADHCKIYQKRPIYWLFDSGKKNGFKALIYMHRYQPDTIARIRTDYVHEQQSRYNTAIVDMENRIASASTGERVKLNKALTKLKDQNAELKSYEEKIHHLADQMIDIDLDDGVKVNYAKFQNVLAKIK